MNEFEKCARWILTGDREEWIVCHGMVVGEHDEDHFSHCWLEHPQNNHAIIMSSSKILLAPADLYRHAMKAYTIDEFTPSQLALLIDKRKHYGPFNADLVEIPSRVLH